jgi:CRISPR-associated endonuclease Cas1
MPSDKLQDLVVQKIRFQQLPSWLLEALSGLLLFDPERSATDLEVTEASKLIASVGDEVFVRARRLYRLIVRSRFSALWVRELAIKRLRGEAAELSKRPPKTVSALLGLEGGAGFAYFNAWQSLPLRWKGISRHPIPRDWHAVGQRYSFAWKKGESRNATHPVNAILNYAYAILESQVRIQVTAAGFDPTIGFLHSGRGGRADFVLDLMEPLRPKVDRKILEFVQAHTFHPADFTIRTDGVCRLNPEIAKMVVTLVGGSMGPATLPFSMKRLNAVGK